MGWSPEQFSAASTGAQGVNPHDPVSLLSLKIMSLIPKHYISLESGTVLQRLIRLWPRSLHFLTGWQMLLKLNFMHKQPRLVYESTLARERWAETDKTNSTAHFLEHMPPISRTPPLTAWSWSALALAESNTQRACLTRQKILPPTCLPHTHPSWQKSPT